MKMIRETLTVKTLVDTKKFAFNWLLLVLTRLESIR